MLGTYLRTVVYPWYIHIQYGNMGLDILYISTSFTVGMGNKVRLGV